MLIFAKKFFTRYMFISIIEINTAISQYITAIDNFNAVVGPLPIAEATSFLKPNHLGK